MEGNVLRVLSLVVVWTIPAMLILAVAAFVLIAPLVTLAGMVLRLYDVGRDKLGRRDPAKT